MTTESIFTEWERIKEVKKKQGIQVPCSKRIVIVFRKKLFESFFWIVFSLLHLLLCTYTHWMDFFFYPIHIWKKERKKTLTETYCCSNHNTKCLNAHECKMQTIFIIFRIFLFALWTFIASECSVAKSNG